MSTLIENLNSIYTTKSQIKEALGTDSDVFADYPAYITAAINNSGVTWADVEQAGYVFPSGTITIDDNDIGQSVDVHNYQYAYIDVTGGGGGTPSFAGTCSAFLTVNNFLKVDINDGIISTYQFKTIYPELGECYGEYYDENLEEYAQATYFTVDIQYYDGNDWNSQPNVDTVNYCIGGQQMWYPSPAGTGVGQQVILQVGGQIPSATLVQLFLHTHQYDSCQHMWIDDGGFAMDFGYGNAFTPTDSTNDGCGPIADGNCLLYIVINPGDMGYPDTYWLLRNIGEVDDNFYDDYIYVDISESVDNNYGNE